MDNHLEEDSPTRGKDSGVSDLLLLKDRALNVAAEGITIVDMRLPDEPLIYVNEGFERLTGYSVDSIIGKNCRFLQSEDSDPATVKKIRDALTSGNECTVEILNRTKNGDPFWNRLSLTPVRDLRGEITHFIGVQSDITARKEAEDAVREVNRQLEIANQRMKRDLEAAARIQHSLLPDKAPRLGNVRFSWVFQPCDELAGDTLNVVPLDEKRFAVYTVDVSGHGVRASLLSVTLSHWFSRLFQGPAGPVASTEGHRESSFAPVEVAEELNRQFQMNMENAQYFTMCYGLIDAETQEFRYVTAGNPPLVVARSRGTIEMLAIEGFPIGIVEQPKYVEQVIKLTPGDRVFLYTDGVVEAEDEQENMYGTEELAAKVLKGSAQSLDDCAESIMESVRAWAGSRGLMDDVSILAFELAE
ncbi:MAG TPA: SpoIIE family protein phosphatase [Acidobacteriota bacterium]|nr:SpoIIE family protein phosphatase [Acidobacteriota bacterium]